MDKTSPSKYNLIANICHEGKTAEEGTYKVQVRHKALNEWFK